MQVGNGQYTNVSFILPVTKDIQCNRFEVYTLV